MTLKKNKEICLIATKKNGYAYHYIDKELRNDRDLILAALEQKGEMLQFVPDIFKKDKEIVLLAIKNDGYSLRYADKKFRKNRDIVLQAVSQNYEALEYATKVLKNDKEIIWLALNQNIGAYKFIGDDFKAELQGQQPLEYLENYFFHQKLQNIIPIKINIKSKKKI